jgi:hypothetical protein
MTNGANWDIENVSCITGSLTVGTSAVELKVGASRLEQRQFVRLYNKSNNTVYWSYDAGVTTSTGEPIVKQQAITFTQGDRIPIYVIASQSGNVVTVHEGS